MACSSYSNLSELVAVIKAKSKAMEMTEPKEIRQLRSGECKVGTNNQYFTTWDLATGMIRDQSTGCWYPLLNTFEDKRFTIEQCCVLLDRFDAPYSNYLRYSGFPELGEFAFAVSKHLKSGPTSQEEAVEAVRAFVGYLNRLAAWSFHYFPWDIGKHLTYDAVEGGSSGVAREELSRRVKVSRDGVKVRLSWDPLGISVIAVFATKENPELCDDVLRNVPFTVVQEHAVVSGESMYAWAPVVSTAPVHVKERQCDAPIGRIRYSLKTGNKIIVQYGEVTEDIETPVLGKILPEYCHLIPKVGRAVLKSTFETKELIMLTLSLV